MALILENSWFKLIAVVMGLLLWFHVATEKEYNHEIHLPVTGITLGDSLTLAEHPPESLLVVVSGTGKQLLRRGWRHQGLRINAAQYRSGQYTVNLSTTNTALADISHSVILDEIISPGSVVLEIDSLTSKEVDVYLDLVTEPDEGFAVSRIVGPEPKQVTIEGARSLLRRTTAISTVRKELAGLRSNISVVLSLTEARGYDISLEPDSVVVKIEVVPVKTRVFTSVPIVIYNATLTEEVRMTPTMLDIELTGPPDDIDLLNVNALVASVDFLSRDSAGLADIKIECPSHFRVRHSSAQTVRFSEP
ncbi:MAG: hypothetical protein KOO62_08475 [candidate division Zixibacteria bacterium]|nr:hypothetical protein [candidate division Zixibacteria bacterium]